jgi:hypothetical protein
MAYVEKMQKLLMKAYYLRKQIKEIILAGKYRAKEALLKK